MAAPGKTRVRTRQDRFSSGLGAPDFGQVRVFWGGYERIPKTEDCLAELGEFELPVPICEQLDNSLGLSFAASGRTDYSAIVRGTGVIFLGGPPLVKAATGEEVSPDELGACDVHTRISGTADYPAHSEEEAIAIARDIVARLKRPQKASEPQAPEPPYYDPAELYGVIPRDNRVQFDMREVIARIVDGSRSHG